MSEVYFGMVDWFDGNFGFITREGQSDLFVHYTGINGSGFRLLKKGQKVSFELGTNNRGQPIATNVVVIK